jgi:hypothetical protein
MHLQGEHIPETAIAAVQARLRTGEIVGRPELERIACEHGVHRPEAAADLVTLLLRLALLHRVLEPLPGRPERYWAGAAGRRSQAGRMRWDALYARMETGPAAAAEAESGQAELFATGAAVGTKDFSPLQPTRITSQPLSQPCPHPPGTRFSEDGTRFSGGGTAVLAHPSPSQPPGTDPGQTADSPPKGFG